MRKHSLPAAAGSQANVPDKSATAGSVVDNNKKVRRRAVTGVGSSMGQLDSP
jgi:hypothetical protein